MSPPEPPPAAPVDTRHRRAWTVTGAVVGAVFAVLIGWWTLRNEGQRITATTIGYKIESDTSVLVSFDVSRPPGLAVTCSVRAMDGHFTVVGTADIAVPPEGEQVVHLQKAVRTTSRAVTGVVQDCVRT
ncbi:MAG TPA: DUF4307 domain-containing protein [Lapillicoccus sp.]|jgi:hypothetical protein|uniref:DUF4307 domain-containing protein n=1 Tax=Lapillicoccus sp. TaxID=1909287 RepID=UPI002F954B38